jgi:hypothetical protein
MSPELSPMVVVVIIVGHLFRNQMSCGDDPQGETIEGWV